MSWATRQGVAAIAYGVVLVAGFVMLFRPEARVQIVLPIPVPEVVRKIEERWPAPIPASTPEPSPFVLEAAPPPSEDEQTKHPEPQPVATPGPRPAARRGAVKHRRPRAPIPLIIAEPDEDVVPEADYVDDSWLAQFFRAAARRAGAIQ